MKSFACRDMGMDCDYMVKDENLDSIVQRAIAHHLKDHEEIFDAPDTMTREELEDKIKAVIKEE